MRRVSTYAAVQKIHKPFNLIFWLISGNYPEILGRWRYKRNWEICKLHHLANAAKAFPTQVGSTWCCELPGTVQGMHPGKFSSFKAFKIWKYLMQDCSKPGKHPKISKSSLQKIPWNLRRLVKKLNIWEIRAKWENNVTSHLSGLVNTLIIICIRICKTVITPIRICYITHLFVYETLLY